MAVAFSVHGRLPSLVTRAEIVRFSEERARDLEWEAVPVSLRFPAAVVREGARLRRATPFRASGLALRPHFACDPLSLVFADDEPVLIDTYVHEGEGGLKTLEVGTLVNTQFGGAETHRELCEFLTDLMAETGCEFRVDDETGYFASRDEAALHAAFDGAWADLRKRLRADGHAPGSTFEIGEFPFVVPDGVRRGEFDLLATETADGLVAAESALKTAWADFGYVLDRSAASVEDLELVASDMADPDTVGDATEAERESAANDLGAGFGRAVVALLGGHWLSEGKDGLRLANVGGVGLVVDPFVVAWNRLKLGPVHSLTNHLRAYRSLIDGLAFDARRATTQPPPPRAS